MGKLARRVGKYWYRKKHAIGQRHIDLTTADTRREVVVMRQQKPSCRLLPSRALLSLSATSSTSFWGAHQTDWTARGGVRKKKRRPIENRKGS